MLKHYLVAVCAAMFLLTAVPASADNPNNSNNTVANTENVANTATAEAVTT